MDDAQSGDDHRAGPFIGEDFGHSALRLEPLMM